MAVPQSLDDFQGMLDDALIINFSSTDLGEIASDGHYVTDESYDKYESGYKKDAYTWSHTVPHLAAVNGDWFAAYQRVLYCNIILDGLIKINQEEDLMRFNYIKGQALFHRASTYFELAQIYTPPFALNDADNPFGLVLRESSDVTIPSRRSSIRETYNTIINDLRESSLLLPEITESLSRPSKVASYALLARIFLCLQEYDSALTYSTKALVAKPTLIDFNTLSPDELTIGRYNPEVIFHREMQSYQFVSIECFIDTSLVRSYELNDLRSEIYYKDNGNSIYSFKGTYNNSPYYLFSGLATDELYLIRAECYARKNDLPKAMQDLNALLNTRWRSNTYTNISTSSKEQALQIIIAEREKELILRGLRWLDLRRLNKEGRFLTTVTRKVKGMTYTLEPNSYKYTFPIPDDVLEKTKIQQNPEWN